MAVDTPNRRMTKTSGYLKVEIFREFVAKLMSLQKQMDASSHDDYSLRDRLMTAVDLPSSQGLLRDGIPQIAQQLANKIAHHFPKRPQSVRPSVVHYRHTKRCVTIMDYGSSLY